MRNSALRSYGMLVTLIGIIATAAAILGVAFAAGLASARGGLTIADALLARDGVFGLLAGLLAFATGKRIRAYSRSALVAWERGTWAIFALVLLSTLMAIVVSPVGIEYLIVCVFYMLLALSATNVRRRNQGFFDHLSNTGS